MLNIKHIYKIEQHGESYSLNLQFNFKYLYGINYQLRLVKQTFDKITIIFTSIFFTCNLNQKLNLST